MTQRGRTGWRRWVVRGAVCVVLGVVTTVGVAWGLAIIPSRGDVHLTSITSEGWSWKLSETVYPAAIRLSWLAYRDDGSSDIKSPSTEFPSHQWKGGAKLVEQSRDWLRGMTPTVTRASYEELRIGWPIHSMVWHKRVVWDSTGPMQQQSTFFRVSLGSTFRVFATIPLTRGFIACVSIYSFAWLVLFVCVEKLRKSRRRSSGACEKCGYDLVHKFDDGCPECGWNRA